MSNFNTTIEGEGDRRDRGGRRGHNNQFGCERGSANAVLTNFRSDRTRRNEWKVGSQSSLFQSPFGVLLLVLQLLSMCTTVDAVEDGNLEPVSTVKWLYGLGGIFFVFIMMPPGIFGGREGIDPVIAFTICWTIIGCWTLRGIAN